MKYRTNLDLMEYLQIVEKIADNYFDENGEYQPHYGKLYAMTMFYNFCVTEYPYKAEHEVITDALDMREVVNDSGFIEAFNAAIDTLEVGYTFADAYNDALNIVNAKINSFGCLVEYAKSVVSRAGEMVGRFFNEETLNQILEVGASLAETDSIGGAIVGAYSKSDRFKELVNSPKEDTGDKVIELNPDEVKQG